MSVVSSCARSLDVGGGPQTLDEFSEEDAVSGEVVNRESVISVSLFIFLALILPFFSVSPLHSLFSLRVVSSLFVFIRCLNCPFNFPVYFGTRSLCSLCVVRFLFVICCCSLLV